MKCYKGIWYSWNLFITNKGERLFITPYRMTGNQYESQFPIKCYILLDNIIVKEIVFC